LPPKYLGKRSELAKILGVKVEGLSTHLKSLSDEQRKVIFYKITHDGPVSLSGIGLKPLVDRSDKVTLAIPTSDSFDKFTKKIQKLETASPENDYVDNQDLVRIEDFVQGEPKDRLSDEFFADYDSMVKQKTIICEIEIRSLEQGKIQRRTEIATILSDLKNAFASGVHGTLFQHQEGDGICRAVIRCTGDMFRRLVEEDKWQVPISWFESKPKFQTVKTVWDNFQFSKLGKITPPDENAPTICIIDSGVSSGNPFLEPVAKEDMLKSFLKQAPEIPSDENGHGSGVASLASYYAINLHEGAENEAKAWIASARFF